MRVSELLTEGVEKFLELAPSVEGHMADKENPHAVTKEDVGLGNVTNDLQAKDADFRSHKEAAVLDHPAGSVTGEKLATGAVTEEKLAEDAVTTAKLKAGGITAEKLADSAVTAEKIAAKAVTAEKLATDSVSGDALRNGCVSETALSGSVRSTIAKKVDKETGKGLSQNDFTDADKAKLDAITVVDGKELLVDTGKLVLKETPLTYCRTGHTYVERKDTVLATNVSKIYGAEPDNREGTLRVAYRDTNGIFKVMTRDGTGKTCTLTGTANTSRWSRQGGYIYLSEMAGNTVTIYRGYSTSNATAELWNTLTISQNGDLQLRDVLVDSNGNIWVMYYTNVESTSSRVYIEFFDSTGTRQWFRFIKMLGKGHTGYATPTNNDTVFDNRFTHAFLYKDELYVASVLGDALGNINSSSTVMTQKYAVLRLDSAGELTGKYHAHNGIGDNNIMQDICIHNGYLYAFGRPYFWRFAIDGDGTGTQLWNFSDINYRLRGITPDAEGRLHAMLKTSDDLLRLVLIRTNTDCNMGVYGENFLVNQELTEMYDMARYTTKGMELFSIPEGTTNLVSTSYLPADVYEAV